jgi:hypothetical protein
VNVDNHFKGLGLHGIYDNKYNRVIITKLDYFCIDDDVQFDEETQEFYIESFINGVSFRTPVELNDLEFFCNKSWTLSFNFNSKSWTSFHSYLPNFYIPENNFFYSGTNGCCDALDAEIQLLAGEMIDVRLTTTTTTEAPPMTTTTTTTIKIDCAIGGTIIETDCLINGTAIITVPPTTTTTQCARPGGLEETATPPPPAPAAAEEAPPGDPPEETSLPLRRRKTLPLSNDTYNHLYLPFLLLWPPLSPFGCFIPKYI